MNEQNKSVTKWATWIVAPDGYVFAGCMLDDNEDECRCRNERKMKDPYWNGYKFIYTPITIPIPDEVANKTIME